MIIKSLSRKSNAAQLVKYVLRYSLKDKHTAKNREQAVVVLKHNLRSRSLEGYVKEFKENEKYRIYKRKDSVVLFHNILSLHPGDKQKISDAILKDIASKFVSLRASNCLCLGIAHKEKEHTHIHLVTSGVQVNGYSARVSKQQFKTIVHTLEAYQREKYPELIHSKNDHQRDNTKSKEQIIKDIKAMRQTTKQSLITELEKIYNESNNHSAFLETLRAKNFEVYNRNNEPKGLVVDGKKFRFSRLGFDEVRLQQLQAKETEEQQITQLQTIREHRQKIKDSQTKSEKSVEKNESISSANSDELQQLQDIRSRVKTKNRKLESLGRERSFTVDKGSADTSSNMHLSQPSLFDVDLPVFELHENEL